MRSICLDHLSLVDIGAVELIDIAAQLGCAKVSLFVTPLPLGPALDLIADRKARGVVLSALHDTGLGVGVVEPFMLDESPDWPLLERAAELAAELGGTINALGFDPEPSRLTDSLGRLAAIAARAGAPMAIEAYPLSAIRSPAEAMAAAENLGPEVGLCIDTLHVIRAGNCWKDIAALPPERLRHIQFSDGPLRPPEDRLSEAIAGRLPPGSGEFDLSALLPHLPETAVLAVETPHQPPPGLSPLERGRILVEALRRLLA